MKKKVLSWLHACPGDQGVHQGTEHKLEKQFDASSFLGMHPQFEWMDGLLKDRPTRPWTILKAGETK